MFENSEFPCKHDMNIITDTSRAYHTPCESQSVVIAASFSSATWVIMALLLAIPVALAVVAMISSVAVVAVVAVMLEVVVFLIALVCPCGVIDTFGEVVTAGM